MRQCKCGGLIREHQLTKNRVAWTCNQCGRYEQINLQEKKMPIGYKQENALQIYGDGDGFIIIEEWETDECLDMRGKVKISYEKFQKIIELHYQELLNEALGIENV